MKIALTASILITTLCCSIVSKGQTFSASLLDQYEQLNQINTRSTFLPNAKITSSSERLIASSNYTFNTGAYNLSDSSVFTWTGDRTSTQDLYSVGYSFCSTFQTMYVSSGKLRNFQRNLQSFDALNNITLVVGQLWDTTTGTWENQTQSIRTYSGSDIIESIEQKWEKTTSNWVNKQKISSNYSSGKLSEVLAFIWNATSGTWDKSSRQTLNYPSAAITERTTYFWNLTSLSFVPNSRTTYTFLGSSISGVLMENYDAVSGVWIKQMQFDNVIVGGLETENYMKMWNTSTADWDSSYKRNNIIVAGKISESITQGWDTSKRIWVNGWKTNYSYTGTNLTTSVQLKWDNISSYWANFEKIEYAHNTNNSLISRYSYNDEGGAWSSNPRKKFYYYETFSSINNPKSLIEKISLYPNPATTDNVYVDFFTEKSEPTEIVLRDVLGRELAHIAENASIGDHSVIIPVKHLSQGIYMVSIYSNGQLQQTMKLVK